MPADISQSSWSETDANNNQTAPLGWTPGSMLPTQVEPTAQAMMGAIKRWWNRQNPIYAATLTTTDTYTVSPQTPVTSFTSFELWRVRMPSANTTTSPTITWGPSPATIQKYSSGSLVNLSVGDIQAQYYEFFFNNTVMVLINPAATSNVNGPASSTTGDIASYADTSGKVLADSGIPKSSIVRNATSSTSQSLPVYTDTSGTVIGNGFIVGTGPSNLVQLNSIGQVPSNLIETSGFVNVLRGNSLSAWFHGTSGTITTSGGWSAEGIYVVPTGASVTWQQLTVQQPGYYALRVIGAASVSDLQTRFVVDGALGGKLYSPTGGGQVVTFQMTVYTNVGSTITPTITVKHAGSLNNWGSPVTDVNAQNMQAVTNNTETTISYSWILQSGSVNGLSIDIDFGNNFASTSNYLNVYSGFDLRATPGVATGINNSPPIPEVRNSQADIAWNQQFFYSTYENNTAPGAATVNGAPLIYGDAATTLLGLQFPVPMIASPTCSMWDLAGTSNKVSAYNGATKTDGFATASISTQDTKRVVVTQAGAAGRVYAFHVTADATITGA